MAGPKKSTPPHSTGRRQKALATSERTSSTRASSHAAGVPDRLLEVETQIQALTARMAALESAGRPVRTPEPRAEAEEVDLELLQRLQSRSGPRYERGQTRGVVTYAGAARIGVRNVLWAREHAIPELLERSPEPVARALSSLGSAPRLTLLATLLTGPRSSQELQDAVGIGSPGQFYHHLKDLMAAGLVIQTERSRYELPPHRIVPLLAVLGAAADLSGEAQPPEGGAGSEGWRD